MITLLLASTGTEPPSDGISVETAVLILMAGGLLYCFKAIADLKRLVSARVTPVAAVPQAASAAPAIASSASAGPSPQVLAAIAAALHVTLAAKYRVLSVVPADQSTTWSIEGRREVFRSHSLR